MRNSDTTIYALCAMYSISNITMKTLVLNTYRELKENMETLVARMF